jgi:phospholipid/cholesterol/gamma-HCH transport system permease protein
VSAVPMTTVVSVLTAPLGAIGGACLGVLREFGHIGIFFVRGVLGIFSLPLQVAKFAAQVYFIGARSVLVICLTGAFTGMVLGLQGYYTLVKFGAQGMLGAAVALSLIREMGPVLTAIMVTARAGSAMSAEIGIMRISEEIDALKTMDINPIRFLVSPRIVAAVISFPLLTAIFDVIGILGGYLSGSVLLGLSSGTFFSRVESSVEMQDVSGGFIKSVVFGLVVATISCYEGYYTHTRPDGFGAKGVSSSTTSAVVICCVLILVTDYIMTSFLL